MFFKIHQLLLFLLVLTFQLCSPVLFAAATSTDSNKPLTLEKRYDEAKFYYNQLQTNANLAKNRDNWLKGTRNFRRIYLSSPKSDLATGCLFLLGRIYLDMYDRFNQGFDLDEAISYFKDIVRLFPQHKLADDSYYSLGKIYLDEVHNPKLAAKFYSEIVTNYRNGDMHVQAENALKILSQEYDIPLPKIMISSSNGNKLNYVLPVKYWSSESYTRVVIMASGPVNYKEVLLEETPKSPRRLYLDFKNSYIEPQYRAPVPIQDGLLRRIRTGQFSPDTVRVVLDIESIGSYKIFSLPKPFRVVIDVRGKADKSKSTLSLRKNSIKAKKKHFLKNDVQRPGSQDIVVLRDQKKIDISRSKRNPQDIRANIRGENTAPSLAQQLGLGVKKIVIDPGHGGKDPGAMAFGLKEKDIVLALAKKLAPILSKRLGCEVILTRSKDIFVPLEERTAIANTEDADLFVSLHVNAHPSAKVRGLETYYLNLSTNAEAMRVAAMENATSTHQMSDLQDILSDIMKNSKIEESSRLAQQVHSSILLEADRQGFLGIKNLGVKQAPFYVLIGAEMPAILVEVVFISNPKDVDNLTNPDFIEMLTQEIATGIRNYVSKTTAQLDM